LNLQRKTSLDVVRILACCLVCFVHFFLRAEYYYLPASGVKYFLWTVVRCLCITCVPVFLLLTGYLTGKKKASLDYYLGIENKLWVYLIVSLLCIWYTRYHDEIPIKFREILNFNAPSYAWYFEMYLGLFMLIPFLALLWRSLGSRKKKLLLVISLIVLTTAPSLLNIVNIDEPGWFSQPTLSNSYVQIIPDWWRGIYPLTYYFIGAYLKEYPLRISTARKFILLVLVLVFSGGFCFYRNRGGIFVWGPWNDWGGFCTMAVSVVLFSLISDTDMNSLPAPLRLVLSKLSDYTFCAYLISWMFDTWAYKNFLPADKTGTLTVKNFLLVPLFVIICSFASSFLINLLVNTVTKYASVSKLVKLILSKKKQKAEQPQTTTVE